MNKSLRNENELTLFLALFDDWGVPLTELLDGDLGRLLVDERGYNIIGNLF